MMRPGVNMISITDLFYINQHDGLPVTSAQQEPRRRRAGPGFQDRENPDILRRLFLTRTLWGITAESQGLFQGINEKQVSNVNGINILKRGVPECFSCSLVSRV